MWYALLCRLLCLLVKHDVQIEPRLQELHALEAQRLHGACDMWLPPDQYASSDQIVIKSAMCRKANIRPDRHQKCNVQEGQQAKLFSIFSTQALAATK